MPENDKYLKTADWEGYKPKVYLDTKKKKTIGHGFNLDDSVIKSYLIKKGYDYNALATGKQSLSEKHSNDILKDLYNQSYKSTEKIIKNFKELPEDVKHVLTDLNYNLGTTRMQKFAKMISAIEKQDFKTAAEELKNSNYYNQTGRRARAHYETLSSVKPTPVEKPASSVPFEPSWGDIGKAYLANPMLPQFAGALLYNKLFSSVPSETPEKQASGGLIKRADGSFSKPGLWDNIRVNEGSGKEPTPEMLKQERKIRRAEKKEDGGLIESYENGGWLDSYEDGSEVTSNPLMNIPESQRFPKQAERTVVYPQGYIENRVNPNAPRTPLNFMGQPFATGAIEESISPLDLIGGVRGGVGLVKGLMKYKQAMKPNYIQIGDELFNMGPHPRVVRRATKQMHKGARNLVLPNAFEDGSWVADSSIPTPTSPNYYPDYTNPTLTNYQMGTPKSNLPIRGLRDATPEIPAYGYGGMINKYAAGATVWTKQDTPTWAAGTPTPTATQDFENTNSINTSRYRIGDVIPTGMDYKTPAAGTKDYSRVMTSYDWNNQRRLHAPDTTIMRGGGNVEENVPGLRYQQLNPGVSEPLGVYTGPTTQRGITFADGGPTGENTVTSADSAALYNNTQALLNYFSTKNKYKNTGSGTTFNSNIHSINSEAVKQMIEDLKNPKTHPYTAERWNSGLTTAGNLLSGFTGIGSVETDQLDPDYDFELKDYYQNVDKNKYKQRELANNIIDTNAPMALYDRRIKPTIAYEFENQNDEYTAINGTNPLFGDIVNFYGYDPNLIKPWHLLTAAEKTKRQQLLNSNNTQAITNTTITSNTRPNTPTVRTTTSIARPVTPLHPIYPKINPMPMRGLTSTIEDVQPQYVDVPKLPVSNMYMDMRGEWSDKPPVPSMSNNMTQAELEKRGYRVPKKAEGGWINSYDGGSYVSDSRDFLKGWYNSPKYKEMLAASVSNEKNPTKAFKIIDEDRRYGLDIPVKSINNLRSKAGAFGLNDASTGQVLVDRQFIEQNPNLASSLVSHELSHNSIMPKSDIAKIQSYTPKYDPKIHSTPGMVNDPRENYDAMTEPEEVRSMIYGLRNLAQKNNIYNTFTQPATKESLEKLSPLFQETEGGKSYDQLKRLKTYFTDEQIIDMMNTISENKNTTQNPPMAKNGGWLDNL